MKPRERVLASLAHEPFDRLPIKHLAVHEVDAMLYRHFSVNTLDELLDSVGHDFREIRPEYRGPDLGDMRGGGDHGVTSSAVWNRTMLAQKPGVKQPLAGVSSSSDLNALFFATTDSYDYTTLKRQCERYEDFARILGYCEVDFINGLSGLRGYEQVLVDIATKEPVFLEIVRRRSKFVYEHVERGLEAAGGLIDFVHLGEDLGTQQGLLLSPRTFLEVFGRHYRAIIDLAHRHGAKTMMHVCGSVAGMIPTLIDLGLDVLDVVQTNAVGMDLADLKRQYGRDMAFAGTMCVQKVIPFGTPEQIRDEVRQRTELFQEGGLIIGPSHQLQVDSPLQNILEMYRAAGGLTTSPDGP